MPPLLPVTKRLLVGLFAAFVVQLILDNWLQVPAFDLLALDPAAFGVPTAWQLVTYIAVQPPRPESVFGILLALLFLWWSMSAFEERYGGKRAVQLSIVAALSASLPALGAGLLFGGRLYGFNPLILASIAGFAVSIRHGTLSFFGLFPMRPMQLILLFVGMSVLWFLASKNVLALVGDLGALGGGILFVRFLQRPPRRRRPRSDRPSSTRFRVIEGGGGQDDRPKWLN